jgi:hypothetical protein
VSGFGQSKVVRSVRLHPDRATGARHRIKQTLLSVITAAVLLAAGPVVTTQGPDSAVTLAVPGRTNDHVSIASYGTFVAVTWAATTPAGATDVYSAISTDGAVSFAAPARVNATAGLARVNGEQPPRVSLVPRERAAPDVVVVWTARLAAGTALVTSRSMDGGRTFGPTTAVAGTEAAGNRGWESVVTDHRGRTFALWLDHRETVGAAGESGGHAHGASASTPAATPAVTAPREDGVVRAQLSQLFSRVAGWRGPGEEPGPRCLLLLQDGDRGRLGRRAVRGMAPRLPGQSP